MSKRQQQIKNREAAITQKKAVSTKETTRAQATQSGKKVTPVGTSSAPQAKQTTQKKALVTTTTTTTNTVPAQPGQAPGTQTTQTTQVQKVQGQQQLVTTTTTVTTANGQTTTTVITATTVIPSVRYAYRAGFYRLGGGFGISLGYSPWYFWDPMDSFWGPYETVAFGWGSCWYYRNHGFLYYPRWRCWYYPWSRCWYFPYDYCWYYPGWDFFVSWYPTSRPYVTIDNDNRISLYCAVYRKQKTASGTILRQVEAPRHVKRYKKLKLYLADRRDSDIILVARAKKDLKRELSEAAAAKLIIVDVGAKRTGQSVQPEEESLPEGTIRRSYLQKSDKQQLKQMGDEIATSKSMR